MSKVIDNIEDIDSIDNHIGLSGITAYHLLQGNLAVDNTVTTQGFNTTLYTGNGSTQSINTGIDMDTQWGNTAEEKFGGLVWLKCRNTAIDHYLFDTVRGAQKAVYTSLLDAQYTYSDALSSFNNNGFILGSNSGINYSTRTQASWNFQTTHRITGTTNHGKAYTCHYNPFTGFTIVKYEGSGIAGHEIPHHLGRKLLTIVKGLSVADAWIASYRNNYHIAFHSTGAEASDANSPTSNESTYIPSSSGYSNISTNQYILYGWTNSYRDESNKLIGNYEVGVYQGTGASGNKVTTRGKPAWVMIKRLDSTGNWYIQDNKRNNFDYFLLANESASEYTTYNRVDVASDGFTITDTNIDYNASGGQYLYMVAYDTNSNGGGGYYSRATDTSNLNISNAIIPYANGVDGNGSKITTLSKNETISGLTLTAGKNYVYSKNDGTYGVSKFEPQYGTYNGFGDYYDVASNKWYSNVSVFANDCSSTSGWTVTSGTLSTYSGTLVLNSGASQSMYVNINGFTIGKKYKLIFDDTGSSFTSFSDVMDGSILLVRNYSGGNITGIKTSEFIATNTTLKLVMASPTSSTHTFTFDNIAIYPIKADGTPDITNATEITTSRNYLNHIVYADNDGSPLYVEELPKVEYKDVIKANEYKGKNACTAWVIFDGTTIPPTIRDSYNVSSVVRVGPGGYEVYFATPMDNVNYSTALSTRRIATWADGGVDVFDAYLNKVKVVNIENTNGTDTPRVNVQIFGGKNV